MCNSSLMIKRVIINIPDIPLEYHQFKTDHLRVLRTDIICSKHPKNWLNYLVFARLSQ